MVNCVRVFKWTPSAFNDLFLDDLDYLGLFFWSEQAQKIVKSMEI